ncbi:MAG: hypothetical protein ACJA1N_000842 [Saprospiraceae bacterium]|jgi:hypothetical protein
METPNHKKNCYNCNTVLSSEDKFCSNCGQKHTTGKVPVWNLVYDFLKNVFNIDAKLPKTLVKLLFFPGRLTTEFFKGKHQSYLKPAQIFVFMTLFCFTIIIFQANSLNTKWAIDDEQKDFGLQINFNEVENNLHRLMAIDTAQNEVDSLLNIVKQKINSESTSALIDATFQDWLPQSPALLDSLNLPTLLPQKRAQRYIKISKKDLILLPEKEVIKKYNIEGFIPRLLFMQTLKSIKHETEIINHFLGRLSWTFFLLVPFFALMLKLFYFRRKQFYVEHLVFTFHFHALLFTIISLVLLIRNVLPIWVWGTLLAYVPLYLFISMKYYYKQRFFKTLLKYILLAISYLFLFIIMLLIIIAIVFVLF